MHIQRVQYDNNKTNFGTRFGDNLTKFISANKNSIPNDVFKNLSIIRNNGIDSVLELEKASKKEQKLGNKYNLNIYGGVFDRVNYYMNWGSPVNRRFQEQISTKQRNYDNKSIFPISIKKEKGNSVSNVLKQFFSQNLLEENIEKEFNVAKNIENEYADFIKNPYKK